MDSYGLRFYAQDMQCEHCAARLKKALLAVEGVTEVGITLENKMVIVLFAHPATPEQLYAAAEEAGYPLTR